MKQFKVDFYQTIYLGSEVLVATDEAEAIKEAEAMNWRAGIGLKWTEDWETEIDHNAEGVFICSEHKQEECQDDECYEEYEELESAGKI